MKNVYSLRVAVIFMAVCITAFTAKAEGEFASGDGSPETPYVITTAEHLVNIDLYPTAYYELGANIDLADYIATNFPEEGWMPISPNAGPDFFSGTLDGKGYAITGLWMNRPTLTVAGLFGRAKDEATFRNLVVKTVKPGVVAYEQVGGLLGAINSPNEFGYDISMENCYFEGDVTGRRAVGGLFGYSYKGTLTLLNCHASGTVTIKSMGTTGPNKIEAAGGLIGSGWNSNTITIVNCYATNAIIADAVGEGENVGGLIGMQGTSGTEGSSSQSEIDKLDKARITIENCVAINPIVRSDGMAGRVHRVAGWIKKGATTSTQFMINNMALDVMEAFDKDGPVTIVSNAEKADGLDVSVAELKLRSTFESSLGFDFMGTWRESETNYPFPVLQSIRPENLPTEVPEELSDIFSTTNTIEVKREETAISFDSSRGMLRVDNKRPESDVMIFDLLGKLLISARDAEIDLSGLANSVYIVKVGSLTIKVSKR